MRKIITKSGAILDLHVWQHQKGYRAIQLGQYFTTLEEKLNRESWVLHESLFEILDRLRFLAGRPIYINSAYRTTAEQLKLQEKNENAASNSPHPYGLAIDIDTRTHKETEIYVNHLRNIAKELNVKIRIGYKKYQPKQTFIHIDVCPEMYGEGGVWEFMPNIPTAFKSQIEW